jgi:transcriptional regulator with XRE-family HTH domain
MARPNRPRSIYAERHVAEFVKREREARGWTLASLAKRMTDSGCAIDASAIFKIESGHPPRRVTVDELVALSAAFGEPIADIVLAPELRSRRDLVPLIEQWFALKGERIEFLADIEDRSAKVAALVQEYVDAHPDAQEIVSAYIHERIPESTWADRFAEMLLDREGGQDG